MMVLAAVLLVGCAAQKESDVSSAIDDFIQVSEVEEQDAVNTGGQFNYDYLTERYVILTTRKGKYLVEFHRRCYELNEQCVTPDIRRNRNVLRAREDTIRGCRIHRLYAIDEGHAEELQSLGKAPGDKKLRVEETP